MDFIFQHFTCGNNLKFSALLYFTEEQGSKFMS